MLKPYLCLTKSGPVVSIRTGKLNGSITVVIPVAGSGERADLEFVVPPRFDSAVTKVYAETNEVDIVPYFTNRNYLGPPADKEISASQRNSRICPRFVSFQEIEAWREVFSSLVWQRFKVGTFDISMKTVWTNGVLVQSYCYQARFSPASVSLDKGSLLNPRA